MPKNILVLGAAGRAGRAVAQMAIAQGHAVTVLVRTPDKLAADLRAGATVVAADIGAMPQVELTALMQGRDAIINCAGSSNDGATFVRLIDHIVGAAEGLLPGANPPCWFFAGVGALDLNEAGRKVVELPLIPGKFRAHLQNYARLRRSGLDWRLLCPGPMVDQPAVGLARLRVSVDKFPAPLPAWTGAAPSALSLPFFARALGEITVPYADAAAVILSQIEPGGPMSRRRVGLALPVGMRLKWT